MGTNGLPVIASNLPFLGNQVFVLFTATNASGFASVELAVPLDPALRGGAAHAQAFVVDPMGPFAGLAFSAGLKLVLRD